jgi:conjugative relaxase-like TrwC/TraI family protein
MVKISKAISASKLQDYHKREFTSPDQSYWSQGQQVVGQWQGQLAEKYGLSGAVGADEFQRLSEGQHPHTGEQLVRHRQPFEYANANGQTVKSVEHRAGWDAQFSPPKSVSLTALVGGDDGGGRHHRLERAGEIHAGPAWRQPGRRNHRAVHRGEVRP